MERGGGGGLWNCRESINATSTVVTLAVTMKRRHSKGEGDFNCMQIVDIRQCHINNLIRLALLCDSPHKIFQSVLCQTIYFSERFWSELAIAYSTGPPCILVA